MGLSRSLEPTQVNGKRCGQHSQNRLIIGETDNRFRPFGTRHMGRMGFFLRRVRRRVRQERVPRLVSLEVIRNRGRNHWGPPTLSVMVFGLHSYSKQYPEISSLSV